MKHKIKNNKLLIFILAFVISITTTCLWFNLRTRITPPEVNQNIYIPKVLKDNDSSFSIGKNSLKKNKFGLWEMYIEGKPYERGLIIGKLSQKLIIDQEDAFVEQLQKLIPSHLQIKLIGVFIKWFNRDLDKYIDNEYLQEIYGISQYASTQYNFVGNNYFRMLNYHAAHDVGHAIQQYHLAACTSLAAWGKKSKDSNIIIGRNFDFYVGEKFAEEKIIAFIKPDKGYPFAYVTWGGMMGVVSGMNIQGLTITINAGKSKIPFSAKTPVSLLARKVLQYAGNIKEAEEILKTGETFVCESFLIGSAEEGKCILIEKSPQKIAVFQPDTGSIVVTNHFQSKEFEFDIYNNEAIKDGASSERFFRVKELLQQKSKIGLSDIVSILRDYKGFGNKDIGLGNEKTINQFIAHHSVIFQPAKRIFWVSSQPWQMGSFVAYDLNKIFSSKTDTFFYSDELTIAADTFLSGISFSNLKFFRSFGKTILKAIDNNQRLAKPMLEKFIASNPNYYEGYFYLAKYYESNKDYSNAMINYNFALSKVIPNLKEEEIIKEFKNKCEIKNNKK